jgi:hypothetical protein
VFLGVAPEEMRGAVMAEPMMRVSVLPSLLWSSLLAERCLPAVRGERPSRALRVVLHGRGGADEGQGHGMEQTGASGRLSEIDGLP